MAGLTILGKATRSAKDLNAWLKSKKCPEYAELYIKAGEEFGVRGDVALFQSCLETGFFTFPGDVTPDQFNMAGIGTTGGGVKGDYFPDAKTGIRAQMQDLALRCGVKIIKNNIIAPYVLKHYDTIAGRGSKTWEDLTGTWAMDPNYHKKIYAIMNEFDTKYPQTTEEPNMELKKVTWFEFNRANDGKPFVTAYDGATAHYTHQVTTINDLYEWAKALKAEKSGALVAETDKKIIPKCPDIYAETPVDPKPRPTTGKKVLLDPGHCEAKPGARGKNSSVQEEDLNRYQAAVLKDALEALGCAVTIYDPDVDDLVAIGKKAQGYDCFISLHLNAYDGREHYTCSMCHSSLQSPGSKSAKVASAWTQAVASASGNTCFDGSAGWPKGVMAAGLSVLNGASQTNCPVFFLSELEFCDDETSPDAIKGRIKAGLLAGAKVLASMI
jgi:N-acetylmuramoyl-L-alanine amidase